MYCNNCGKAGHLFHQCRAPITSHGLVVVRYHPTRLCYEYLLIRRKDTLGYIDFMRGKYNVYNRAYLLQMFRQMTQTEKRRLLRHSFPALWRQLWQLRGGGDEPKGEDEPKEDEPKEEKEKEDEPKEPKEEDKKHGVTSEEGLSHEKFMMLQRGIAASPQGSFSLASLVADSDALYPSLDAPEWGFPKGRRDGEESDLQCAIRESSEETGFAADAFQVVRNVAPYEETFTGSNYKSYKHKYSLAVMEFARSEVPTIPQRSEVSAMAWMDATTAEGCMRDYNVEKKTLLRRVHALLSSSTLSACLEE